jgi:hypothetical protein
MTVMTRAHGYLALLAMLLPPSPGAAPASAPADGPSQRATFGVRPSGAKDPDGRPTFAYAATPGGVVADHVEISNASTRPLTLRVYASDAFNPQGGGFDLLAAGHTPTDVGAWTAVAHSTVTVPARSATIVAFTLRIPANATPGDHAGGIVATLATDQTDAKGDRVTVDQRVGARIYLRVTGALQPALAVEGLSAQFHPNLNPFGSSHTTLTYRVRNAGNVRLGARQRVTVGALWGDDTAPGVLDIPEILPGNAVDVTTDVPSAFPTIWRTTRVHAEPVAQLSDQGLAISPTEREQSFWAVSWTALALLVAAIGAAFLGWRGVRRRRRSAGAAIRTADHGQP